MAKRIPEDAKRAHLSPKTTIDSTKESRSIINKILDMEMQQIERCRWTLGSEVHYADDVRVCVKYAEMSKRSHSCSEPGRCARAELREEDRPSLFIVPFARYLNVMCHLHLIDAHDISDCLVIIIENEDTTLPRKLARLGNIRYDWRYDERIHRDADTGEYVYTGDMEKDSILILQKSLLYEMGVIINDASNNIVYNQTDAALYTAACAVDAILSYEQLEDRLPLHESTAFIDLIVARNVDPLIILGEPIRFRPVFNVSKRYGLDKRRDVEWMERLLEDRAMLIMWYRKLNTLKIEVDVGHDLYDGCMSRPKDDVRARLVDTYSKVNGPNVSSMYEAVIGDEEPEPLEKTRHLIDMTVSLDENYPENED